MRKTILLIEDDPLSARLADLLLSSEGYEVITTSDGAKGLSIAREVLPDLVLLDLMLPGSVDGFDVLNELRRDPVTADVQVVIVSSKSQPADRETATKIGADDYLTKPYRKTELLDTVRSMLNEGHGPARASGTSVLLVGPHGNEATPVVLQTGLALAELGEDVTVVDLHPFSVEHSALLDVPPRTTPAALDDPATIGHLGDLAVEHPGGLRLLNNLEGSGSAGQLTSGDAGVVLDALAAEGSILLIDLPLYPASILGHLASRCSQVVLVTRSDPATSAAALSALAMMERGGVGTSRVGIVVVGSQEGQDVPGQLLAVIADATDVAACRELAIAFRDLKAG